MKKLFRKLSILVITSILFCTNVHAQLLGAVSTLPGSITLDPSSWLTALDDLYATYDMVTNTITQIENQYTQIQQAIERAKSIDWSNISFDGDFDIRNDIKDANKKVNKMLNSARTIKESLTTSCINAGGTQYSLADLCGRGADGKNIYTAFQDVTEYMSANMKIAINHLTEELSEEQKIAIWKKYGISPKNYIFVQQTKATLQNKINEAMGIATEEAEKFQYEQKTQETNNILKAVYETLDSEGNPTSAATQEALMHLSTQMVYGLLDAKTAMDRVAGLIANNQLAEEAEKQALADEEQTNNQIDENRAKRSPSWFKLK